MGRPPKPQRVEPCPSCGRLTRPHHTTPADYPGTLSRQRGGMCPRCINRIDHPPKHKPEPKPKPKPVPKAVPKREIKPVVVKVPCTHDGCDRMVAAYSASKLCRTHRVEARRVEARRIDTLPPPEALHPDDRKNRQALEDYWADRRRRGIPPEGTAA